MLFNPLFLQCRIERRGQKRGKSQVKTSKKGQDTDIEGHTGHPEHPKPSEQRQDKRQESYSIWTTWKKEGRWKRGDERQRTADRRQET